MINDVVLIGRITKDIEVKSTSSGIPVSQFILAVDRPFKNEDGERDADFISCVIWRKGAENLSKFTHKGSLIGIQGRLQTRSYENKDGQRVFVTEVVIDHFSLLDSKKESKKDTSNADAPSNNLTTKKHDSIPNAENVANAKTQETQSEQQLPHPTSQATQTPIQNQSTQAPSTNNQNAGGIEDLFNQPGPVNLDDDDLPF